MHDEKRWTVVLAAGDGSRLARWTTDRSGCVVPKQFCCLRGGRSLLRDTLVRARAVSNPDKTLVVVAARHRRHWERELHDWPQENIVVQPLNRGTAAGILLPVLTILERDPSANIAVLPSDHFVHRERILTAALETALDSTRDEPGILTLLGISPDSPDNDYGWIVPGEDAGKTYGVSSFVEKPHAAVALRLLQRGALWNSFIFAAKGSTLAAMYQHQFPELLARFQLAFEGSVGSRAMELERLYGQMSTDDFSRGLLQNCHDRLRVVRVPDCGWTDLGTPQRVQDCLHSLPMRAFAPSAGTLVELENCVVVPGSRRARGLQEPIPLQNRTTPYDLAATGPITRAALP